MPIHARLMCPFHSGRNFSLCFIVVEEKESKKSTSRQRKINIFHKANGDHVTNTHVASLYVFVPISWRTRRSSSSALSFAVDVSEGKEKCSLNLASKRVNHLAASSKRNLHIVGTSCFLLAEALFLLFADVSEHQEKSLC